MSTKPIPGESAEADVEGCGVESASRRQERAKTPERRMAVPRAICIKISTETMGCVGTAYKAAVENRESRSLSIV